MFIFLIPVLPILTVIFGQTYLYTRNQIRANIKRAHPITPGNTIIIFDLHGVVFKHNYTQMILTFVRSSEKWPFLKNMLNPHLLWNLIKLIYKRPIPESFFMYVADNYKQMKEALPLIIRIANCQLVNQSIIPVIQQLKQQGFELALLSNIGERIYTDLELRHHDIFHLFDHIMVAAPESHYVSKPNPKIYALFLKEVNRHHKHIIFIDDKQKNVCGGLPFGMIGIRFTNTARLIKRLATLGINCY